MVYHKLCRVGRLSWRGSSDVHLQGGKHSKSLPIAQAPGPPTGCATCTAAKTQVTGEPRQTGGLRSALPHWIVTPPTRPPTSGALSQSAAITKRQPSPQYKIWVSRACDGYRERCFLPSRRLLVGGIFPRSKMTFQAIEPQKQTVLCRDCRAKADLIVSMTDPRNGRTLRIFRCRCEKITATSE